MVPTLRTLWKLAAALDMKPSQLVAEIETVAEKNVLDKPGSIC